MEINPNHPTTRAISDQWHKLVAILLSKFDEPHVVITAADIERLGDESSVVVQELQDGLHVRIVDNQTAMRLAREHGGLQV